MATELQWGGRFATAPDAKLLEFGSSLEDDFVLAPFDVQVSRAHVAVLAAANLLDAHERHALDGALASVLGEIESGQFAGYARALGAEDIHGAIDARVRELAGPSGERLHAGRSRNDQVATALALYARDRARAGHALSTAIARAFVARARRSLAEGTTLAAATHWQPAQPVLLAFWLAAAAETFARAARRLSLVESEAREACPLGAGACSGSTLPLDRALAAHLLGFKGPARNALDSAGDRDLALDLLNALARAVVAASRVAAELVVWCTPAVGYARLGEEASTGSSLMPQKRNPDPFELVRAAASSAIGAYSAALGTIAGLPLSYHRDLQETKRHVLVGVERGLLALDAFARAFEYVEFDSAAMAERAGEGYTVATDVADALIAKGVAARRAHAAVGERVAAAEGERRPLDSSDLTALAAACGLDSLDAPLDAAASIAAKSTAGSTNPSEVARSLDALEAVLA